MHRARVPILAGCYNTGSMLHCRQFPYDRADKMPISHVYSVLSRSAVGTPMQAFKDI